MKKYSSLFAASLLSLALAACSDNAPAAGNPTVGNPAAGASIVAPTVDFAAVQKSAKGFTVGSVASANTVYVFFDAQCPHCGRLWEAAKPLASQAKFVWIPVAVLNRASYLQGATLLSAADPAKAMAEHEESLMNRKGGITVSMGLPHEAQDAVKANTELLSSFKVESIPFIVATNIRTKKVVSQAGSLSTNDLAALVGLTPVAAAAPTLTAKPQSK